MKYTNKHIKEEYKLNQIGRTIGMILLVIGILLVGFGMNWYYRKNPILRIRQHILILSGYRRSWRKINMKDITL